MTARIGIVLGSHSDVKRIEKGLKRLEALEVPFEMCIASAHRTPGRLMEWLRGAEARGVKVIVAGAGAAAHLPGVVASKTILPVIGVPFDASPLKGVDALYSIVQMPPGIPVATVGIDSAENAVVLALHVLATSDEKIAAKLRRYRATWQDKIAEQNERLYEQYPHARPEPPGMPPVPEGLEDEEIPEIAAAEAMPEEPAAAESAEGASRKGFAAGGSARKAEVWRLESDMPELEAIERAADVLRGGGIVAIPTDTVYGLAADATRPEAVARLFRIKERAAAKAIPVLIDSEKLFRTLIVDIPRDVEDLIERHWPGPLTLVARKRRSALRAVSADDSLGVRMPDNMVALSVSSMLERPLATTSANLAEMPPATSGSEVRKWFGDKVDLILDCGPIESAGVSTVLSVLEKPYAILREGALEREVLREVLGDLLA